MVLAKCFIIEVKKGLTDIASLFFQACSTNLGFLSIRSISHQCIIDRPVLVEQPLSSILSYACIR